MKKLINKLNFFIRTLFDKAYKVAKANSVIAVRVTQMLKTVVESPFMDIVTDIIPIDYDDEILYILRREIPKVAMKVAIFSNIVQESDKSADAVEKIILYLKGLNPQGRLGFWVTFAGELNIALSDGKLTFNESVILTQLAYNELYKK